MITRRSFLARAFAALVAVHLASDLTAAPIPATIPSPAAAPVQHRYSVIEWGLPEARYHTEADALLPVDPPRIKLHWFDSREEADAFISDREATRWANQINAAYDDAVRRGELPEVP